METAREFRLKLKSASSVGGKKGQAAVPAAKPTHATVFVAKTYPPWQCTVLSVLKQFYESGNGGDNKAISQVWSSFLTFCVYKFFTITIW